MAPVSCKNLIEFDEIAYALSLNSSGLGLLRVSFREYTTQIWPYFIVKTAQYLVKELMEFDQVLHVY